MDKWAKFVGGERLAEEVGAGLGHQVQEKTNEMVKLLEGFGEEAVEVAVDIER